MKRSKLYIVLALLGVALSFSQCGSDPAPAPDPQDEQLTKLSKTWKVTANGVTFASSGVPQTVSGYDNFTITLSGTAGQDTFNYSVTGRPAGVLGPWAASGTFTFGTDFATIVNRDDGTIVTYAVTATNLQMTFNYTGAGYTGRKNVVNGNWSFSFVPQ